ncbi:MAG TPA: glycosyltransferase, partial [Candidatus Sulfotelmatobacter sp.]|nr:glycosyltransferase [Candidatus Sulfotelmatobacter sp.]
RIAVIIPARDEAHVIGRAIRSLLLQTGALSLHIFLVDDGSSDNTAQVAREAAASLQKSEMLTVLEGAPLPPGWSGKLWAIEQAVEQASARQPDFFLFTDADIVHAPASVSELAAIAREGPYDLASLMVRLHCETPAEKFLIPAFVFFFFKLYPPAWIANPRRAAAGAAGGCILVRPAALQAAGGIAAIRQEVIDDCALAARIKSTGGRLWLGASQTTESVRPYHGLADIAGMISRTAFNQLRHSTLLLLLAIVGMAVTYLLPPALVLFSRHWLPALLGATAWLLMALSFLPVLRLYHLAPLWALALPLMAFFYIGATFHSAWKYWSGRGGEWKGRVQDPLRDQR